MTRSRPTKQLMCAVRASSAYARRGPSSTKSRLLRNPPRRSSACARPTSSEAPSRWSRRGATTISIRTPGWMGSGWCSEAARATTARTTRGLGEFAVHEGIVIPRGAQYWFQSIGDEDLELVQVVAFDRDVKNERLDVEPRKLDVDSAQRFNGKTG